MRVSNSPPRDKPTRLHAPGGACRVALSTACGVQGPRRISDGRVAVLSPANHTYLIAKPGEAVTCSRCAAAEG